VTTTTLIRSETRTDFIGSYTAYIYSDGHVETEPAGRPIFKEDYQRQRAIALSQSDASNSIAAAKIAATTTSQASTRELTGFIATAGIFDDLRQTQTTLATLLTASTASDDDKATLLSQVPAGGDVVGPRAATSPSFSAGDPSSELR
jgi:hypothetical protein